MNKLYVKSEEKENKTMKTIFPENLIKLANLQDSKKVSYKKYLERQKKKGN